MPTWSIEEELQSLTQTKSIEEAVNSLDLLPPGETFNSIRSEQGWIRRGAETFQVSFQVVTKSGGTYKYLLKACAIFGVGKDIPSVVSKWQTRRHLLDRNKVATPKLYACANGVILEEFIPYSLADILITDALLLDLACLAGILAKLGFLPIDGVFGDLRSHSNDIVVVDFGEDLGPPNVSRRKDDHLLFLMLNQLKKWGVEISPSSLNKMRPHFQSFNDS